MLYEYAIEPEAIAADWATFRNVIDRFGFDKGRAISRFPNSWEREVMGRARAAGMPEVEHARLVEKLKYVKEAALIRTGRQYNSELAWPPNAIASHQAKPFHAIIAKDADGSCERLMTVDDLEEAHPLIRQNASVSAPRTVEGLVNALFPLLLLARDIEIIDPFFDARNPKGQDFLGPIQKLLADLHAAGKRNVIVRMHYRTHDSRPPLASVRKDAGKWFDGIIPDGFCVELNEWKERTGGEAFHDRFLLCDCGGLQLGHGFEAVGAHQSVNITRLGTDHANEIAAKYRVGTAPFDSVYSVVRVLSDGQVK
jgi:hypothetical protein